MHYIVIFLCFPYFIVHITSKDLNRSCPPLVQNERCEFEQKFDTCQTNTDCKYGKICCPRKCGLRCIKKDQKQYNPSCPPYRTDVICKRFDRQCSTDKNCKGGQICCRVECGTVCKPGENIYLPTDICPLPKVTGPCKAYMPRYYYSKKVKKCLRFIYGGCEGNKNNFETLEQCKQRCEPEDPCPLPKCPLVQVPIGVCSRETFFDFDGVKCKGCPEIVPCNKECLLPKDIGPCDADIKRHYYDTKTKSCKEFRYGGCEGNKNNFITLDACKSSCRTEPCPQVKCSNRCPYGFQTTTDGCPTCICTTKCPQGKPLPRLNCGLIPNPDKCPKGYFCSVDEIDRFAVCCRDPCFPPPRCPQPPRGPPGTCPPQCVYEYAIVNGKSCRVACKLGPVGPKGEPGKPCPPSLCSDGIAEPKPPPPPPPQKDRCDPLPRCPRPDRGPPGECPPKCIYEYETVNGKRCKVGCHLGEKGPLVQQGERCPPRMCQDVENEPIGPRDPVERTPSPAFIKRDNCPPNSDDRICYYYDRKCTDDSSCAKGKKCCKQGCSHVCVKSV